MGEEWKGLSLTVWPPGSKNVIFSKFPTSYKTLPYGKEQLIFCVDWYLLVRWIRFVIAKKKWICIKRRHTEAIQAEQWKCNRRASINTWTQRTQRDWKRRLKTINCKRQLECFVWFTWKWRKMFYLKRIQIKLPFKLQTMNGVDMEYHYTPCILYNLWARSCTRRW